MPVDSTRRMIPLKTVASPNKAVEDEIGRLPPINPRCWRALLYAASSQKSLADRRGVAHVLRSWSFAAVKGRAGGRTAEQVSVRSVLSCCFTQLMWG